MVRFWSLGPMEIPLSFIMGVYGGKVEIYTHSVVALSFPSITSPTTNSSCLIPATQPIASLSEDQIKQQSIVSSFENIGKKCEKVLKADAFGIFCVDMSLSIENNLLILQRNNLK